MRESKKKIKYPDDLRICANCRHRCFRGSIWHEQFCGHEDVQFVAAIDPVTGEEGYSPEGCQVSTLLNEHPMPFCRDVNRDGKCRLFKA
jgi:hypothetical protein